MLSKFLAYLNLLEFSLKPEQEMTVRDLIEGKDVLVVMARASSIKYLFAPGWSGNHSRDFPVDQHHRRSNK